MVWDYLFCGVHLDISTRDNPFSNLDFLCVAMMITIQKDLLDNEDSACLGILMSFKEPENVIKILEKAQKIRLLIIDRIAYKRDSDYESE